MDILMFVIALVLFLLLIPIVIIFKVIKHSNANDRAKVRSEQHVDRLPEHALSWKMPIKQTTFLFSLVIAGFLCSLVGLSRIYLTTIGNGDFFVLEVIPLPYWIGITLIAVATFLSIKYAGRKGATTLSLVSSIIFMACIRMVFPIVYPTPAIYEPDVLNYMPVVDSWARSGINLGFSGLYQHDYPMSFVLAFIFVKLGVSVNTFFRVAPFFVYATEVVLLYLICTEIFPEDKRYSAAAAFLFSLSPQNYWISVHYCPDLIGSLFYFLSLYLVIRYVKRGLGNLRNLALVCLSILALMLSHHLSMTYFIVTMIGFAVSAKFLKIKGKDLGFFILAVFSYTVWFIYGHFMYPGFFDVYVYFTGFAGPIIRAQGMGLYDSFLFLVFPAFITILFIFGTVILLGVHSFSDMMKLLRKPRNLLMKNQGAITPFEFSFGFVMIAFLFVVGFAVPVLQSIRILEVLLIGVYPISARAFIKMFGSNSSKKWVIVLLCIATVLVMFIGVGRYYRQIQRRVLFP